MRCSPWLRVGLSTGLLSAACLGTALTPTAASAFCGFYVAGADTDLYANATMVVLMREGTKTVLSMQNNYQGPPTDFAMVIPVPTVLSEEQVKVLPQEVFTRVDSLGAPRLVEYWEQNPCPPPPPPRSNDGYDQLGANFAAAPDMAETAAASPPPVVVEAEFAVGEYDVVILSAEDSTALDTWLRGNAYNIPEGADAVLAPYVAAGTKFFVAKVDPSRVTFEGNQAVLSPLRFHYDSEEFSLPVRLGLLNSQGSQDLLVNILAEHRYELANYDNATIPTNIRVHNEVRDNFGGFYESLFSEVLEKKPGAVVTEYSWTATSCDPCPTQPLDPSELLTLGADVLSAGDVQQPQSPIDPRQQPIAQPTLQPTLPPPYARYPMTLTRLHYRYNSEDLGEDLVFKQASPIHGGRGTPDREGELDAAVIETEGSNTFQGRYTILHPWEKAIACDDPQRGLWGGPSGNAPPRAMGIENRALMGAAPMAADLSALIAEGIPELNVEPQMALQPFEVPPAKMAPGPRAAATSDTAIAGGAGLSTEGEAHAAAPTATSPTAAIETSGEPSRADGCSCRVGSGTEPDTNPPAQRFPSGSASAIAAALLWLRGRRRVMR